VEERGAIFLFNPGYSIDHNLLFRATPCFGRHVKPLVPIAFAIFSTHSVVGLTLGRRPVVKIIAESLSQHDEKHAVPAPLSGIRVGGRYHMRQVRDIS
jgi:hypothetical protein